MAKIERVSENLCVAKCVHTSVWTTLAIGACLKVDTFYPPSYNCAEYQPFLRLLFHSFGFLMLYYE